MQMSYKSMTLFSAVMADDRQYEEQTRQNILVELVRSSRRKYVKLNQDNWQSIAISFNNSTGENLSWNQVRKKYSNTRAKLKRNNVFLDMNTANINEDSNSGYEFAPTEEEISEITNNTTDHGSITTTTTTTTSSSYEQVKSDSHFYYLNRTEVAKEMAEVNRFKAEEVRLKKEELLAQAAIASLNEAETKAKMAALDLEAKRTKYAHLM
jgi:hypothetical protein